MIEINQRVFIGRSEPEGHWWVEEAIVRALYKDFVWIENAHYNEMSSLTIDRVFLTKEGALKDISMHAWSEHPR